MSKTCIVISVGCQNLTLLPFKDVKILYCFPIKMPKHSLYLQFTITAVNKVIQKNLSCPEMDHNSKTLKL